MSTEPNDSEYTDAIGRIEAHPVYSQRPERNVRTDALAYRWAVTYWQHRQTKNHEDAIRSTENDICLAAGRPAMWEIVTPPVPPTPPPVAGRRGRVTLANRCMVDADGPFCALGASMFWAAWGARHDHSRAWENMRWLADRGVQFVRVLAEVGGGDWRDRTIDPRDPGWTQQLRDTMALAQECGLRVEWTVFGSGVLTREAEWDRATDLFIDAVRPHVDLVQFVEIQNESLGPPRPQARALAARVRAQLGVPVAITGCPESDLDDIYAGSQANVLTIHCDRSPKERMWRPVRQIKHELEWAGAWVNNEPIGIVSSVAKDDDPVRLAAGAITSWLVGSCAHVIHHGAGIYGKPYVHPFAGPRTANAWEQPPLEPALALIVTAKRRLPTDLPNWSRKGHGWADHPLRFATDVGDAVEAGADGINRGYAAVASDGRWVCLLAGIQRRVEFTMATPAALWSLSTGKEEHVGPGRYALAEAEWGTCVLLTSE